MRFAAISLGVLSVVSGSGCSAGVSNSAFLQTSAIEQVAQTNFTIGEARTAVVGEPIVRVKDYVVKRITLPALKASVAGSAQLKGVIGGDAPPVPIDPSKEYPIAGERTVDGKHVRIAQLAGEIFVQIYDDGTPRNKEMTRTSMGMWVEVLPEFVFHPPGLTFSPVVKTDETAIPAGENYEIIFTGRDQSSMRFQYREYTSEDMARPAFSQDLTYPLTARTIRFRGLTIDVQTIGDDTITYRVVSRTPRSAS